MITYRNFKQRHNSFIPRVIYVTPILVLTVIVTLSLITHAWHRQVREVYPAAYTQALSTADRARASDELSALLTQTHQVKLSGGGLKNISRMSVASNGTICVVDALTPRVHLFSEQGSHMRALGGRGNRPGEYLTPTACAADGNAFIVSDFTNHRITEYAQNGLYRDSFIYTAQNFGATNVVVNANPSRTKEFLLLGTRWQKTAEGEIVPATLLHSYSAQGDFIRSQLTFPRALAPLHLERSGDLLTATSPSGQIYVSFPFQYSIYALQDNGLVAPLSYQPPNTFKPPSTPFMIEGRDIATALAWQLTWTPIVAIGADSTRMFVEYQTFNPLRYTIDAWDVATHHLIRQYHTNRRLLASDNNRELWFLADVDPHDKDEYDIIIGSTLL